MVRGTFFLCFGFDTTLGRNASSISLSSRYTSSGSTLIIALVSIDTQFIDSFCVCVCGRFDVRFNQSKTFCSDVVSTGASSRMFHNARSSGANRSMYNPSVATDCFHVGSKLPTFLSFNLKCSFLFVKSVETFS